MLPKVFQEEVVFWYYDTWKHTEEAKKKDRDTKDETEKEKAAKKKAENAFRLLWERLNTDKLPKPLNPTLNFHEQRRALDAAKREEKRLQKALEEQKLVVEKFRKAYE